jgi:hypothetical protein
MVIVEAVYSGNRIFKYQFPTYRAAKIFKKCVLNIFPNAEISMVKGRRE